MDHEEKQVKKVIREGLILYAQNLIMKRTNNPYAILSSPDLGIDNQLLNRATEGIYSELSEKSLV